MVTQDFHLIAKLESATTGADVHTIRSIIGSYVSAINLLEMNEEDGDTNEAAMNKEYIEYVETSIRKVINGGNARKISQDMVRQYTELMAKFLKK